MNAGTEIQIAAQFMAMVGLGILLVVIVFGCVCLYFTRDYKKPREK